MEFGFSSQKVSIFPGPPLSCMHSCRVPGPVGLAASAVSASCRRLATSLPLGAGREGHRKATLRAEQLCGDSLWGVGRSISLPEPQLPDLKNEKFGQPLSSTAVWCSRGACKVSQMGAAQVQS